MYGLYGRINGDFQESLYQGGSSKIAAASVPMMVVSPCQIPKINQNKVMLCKINSGDDIEYGDGFQTCFNS